MAFDRHRSGPCVAIVLGPQQAHVWQSTGTEMAIKRRTHGSEHARKWPICGSCSGIHNAQMWQSTGTYMAGNRHIHGNQQAHTWQSTGTYMAINRHIHDSQHAHSQQSHAHGPYMAVVCAYERYRGGNN